MPACAGSAIATRGSTAEGEADVHNRSSVWTPLLHAVWKPDPKGRDQVRFSLTRSYRSPPLNSLIARPSINTRYPVPGPNTPTQPDRAGNPALKPELATGIDVAIERYLPGGGMLSANVFHRHISDYMRSVTTLETVPYATVAALRAAAAERRRRHDAGARARGQVPPQRALAAGAAHRRARQRQRLPLARRRSVPGPDNRLDQQPDGTANVGADYRFRGAAADVGGNVNWTPGYTTRLSDTQTASIGRKLVVDAYALWTFSPAAQLRLTASNLASARLRGRQRVDGPDLQDVAVRETSRTTPPTYLNCSSGSR